MWKLLQLYMGRMVKLIRQKLPLFNNYRVKFTKRVNNRVAHYLAKQAHIEGNRTWIDDVPMFIRAQLCKDIFY